MRAKSVPFDLCGTCHWEMSVCNPKNKQIMQEFKSEYVLAIAPDIVRRKQKVLKALLLDIQGNIIFRKALKSVSSSVSFEPNTSQPVDFDTS